MKMNFGKRLVLFLHWLLAVVLAVAVVLCGCADSIQEKIGHFTSDSIALYIMIGFAVLFVLLSLGSVWFILRNDAKRTERGFITMDASDTGKVRIAISAVEQMVKQAVCNVDGINDMKINVAGVDDSIEVRVNVVVVNGAHVPTVTLNMQRAIRQFVEMNCGVAVSNVSINVSSVTTTSETPVMKIEAVQPIQAQSAPVETVEEITPAVEPAQELAEEAYSEPTVDEEIEEEPKVNENE